MKEGMMFYGTLTVLAIAMLHGLKMARKNAQDKAKVALDEAFAKKHKRLKVSAEEWT